jgi:hypothetical protein
VDLRAAGVVAGRERLRKRVGLFGRGAERT